MSSLEAFSKNTSSQLEWNFDYERVMEHVLRRLGCRVPVATYWEAPSKGSRGYPRSHGGKRGEAKNEIYVEFMHLPITTIAPDKPSGDLYDILGNVALYVENWDEDQPIGQVLYANRGQPRVVEVDDRFGMIGFYWALYELRKLTTLEWSVDEDLPFLGVERVPTVSILSGSVPARIIAQPEEGWKVRIITLIDFCVSIIGSMCRHLLDPALIGMDPLIRIGLRSKVKLYDSLVFLNGNNHSGISTTEINNVMFDNGNSVDLTTATDTPDRRPIASVFRGWANVISGNHPCRALILLGINLATSGRDFEMPRGFSSPEHRSGIMMGEGLSGIFLNSASLLVRILIRSFKLSFPEIENLSVGDVDEFILRRQEDLQSFLDNFDTVEGMNSSQSGDDMFDLSNERRSLHLVVLYRMLGFFPSATTWFESTQYITFCEEHAFKTHDSNGWTFVDTVKPRFFNIENPDPEKVSSRIRQISGVVGYRKDVSIIREVVPVVNRMLELVPEITNTLRRLRIPAGLPGWLGGIDHPEAYLPEFELDDETKKILSFLQDASLETLIEEYMVKSFDDFAVQNQTILTMTSSFLSLQEVTSIQEISPSSYIARTSIPFPERGQGEKWSLYTDRCNSYIKSSGLVSIKQLIDEYTSAVEIRRSYQDPDWESGKVAIGCKMRARRRHLRAILPDDYELVQSRDLTPWGVSKGIERKLGHRYVHNEFVEALGILNLPSFQVKGNSALWDRS
jgi:hypothetical protein